MAKQAIAMVRREKERAGDASKAGKQAALKPGECYGQGFLHRCV